MNIRVFTLPTIYDGILVIEKTWCELNTKMRNGAVLDEVELTWLDQANSWFELID